MESYKTIEQFVRSGTRGETGHDSAKVPFFMGAPAGEGAVGYGTLEVNQLLEKVPLPPDLRKLYQVIGDKEAEFYFGLWTLRSLEQVNDRYEIMKEDNQHRVIDFAIRSLGMGHALVAFYDPQTDKVYYRHDGGSNGYEREAHYNWIKGYCPEPEKGCSASDWMSETKNETWDPMKPFELQSIRVVNE